MTQSFSTTVLGLQSRIALGFIHRNPVQDINYIDDPILSAADRFVYLIGKHTFVAEKRSRLGHCAVSAPKWIPTFRKHYDPWKLQENTGDTARNSILLQKMNLYKWTSWPAVFTHLHAAFCINANMSIYLNSDGLYLTTANTRILTFTCEVMIMWPTTGEKKERRKRYRTSPQWVLLRNSTFLKGLRFLNHNDLHSSVHFCAQFTFIS